ncbi:DEAD/DEAH box helicase [Chengkuizengella axinellae]|uniref:Helicase-related protein n=1 Tax=Chengkuizengella axinellae TaxID=3064388 RepID=A0ABT9J2N9_9BACL|nr:DEAD/DEAH box helicase [Chengkuizengella sp. 2205SS18-9]MDP5275872.1 helicase-related protein [Chengkuizengella sp. 2205SS18-9]
MILYAVHPKIHHIAEQVGWRWYISLNMKVDYQYWFKKMKLPYIVLLHPPLPLGAALTYCKVFNSNHDAYTRMSQNLKQVQLKWIQFMYQHRKKVRLNEKVYKQLYFETIQPYQVLGEIDFQITTSIERKWMHSIQGRGLLQSEFIQVIQSEDYMNDSWWTLAAQYLYITGKVQINSGITVCAQQSLLQQKQEYICNRCGSGQDAMYENKCLYCGQDCIYCEKCITMGKSRYCTPLIQGIKKASLQTALQPSVHSSYKVNDFSHWNLSEPQTEAVRSALTFLRESTQINRIDEPLCYLIWAVTGAGKTEMIFPLIEHEITLGRQVMLATPRKDVVLELQPRLQKAFPHLQVVTLYGGSTQKWEEGDLFIATTHQLIRFWQKFDLVIIDELDAFPYHNNAMLQYAAKKACKKQGRYLFLSATPPSQLIKEIKRDRLPHVKVPVRYHRNPLPVPQRVSFPSLTHLLKSEQSFLGDFNRLRKEKVLIHRIKDTLNRSGICFIFLPKIKYISPIVQFLSSKFKHVNVQGVSSIDKEREQKVQAFRKREIHILITTTILERGVTVPNTDVYIMDADSNLFDEAALVQMAGRAGRSAQYPNGKVYFFSKEKTKHQVEAIKQIKEMNALADKKGYLKNAGEGVN